MKLHPLRWSSAKERLVQISELHVFFVLLLPLRQNSLISVTSICRFKCCGWWTLSRDVALHSLMIQQNGQQRCLNIWTQEFWCWQRSLKTTLPLPLLLLCPHKSPTPHPHFPSGTSLDFGHCQHLQGRIYVCCVTKIGYAVRCVHQRRITLRRRKWGLQGWTSETPQHSVARSFVIMGWVGEFEIGWGTAGDERKKRR